MPFEDCDPEFIEVFLSFEKEVKVFFQHTKTFGDHFENDNLLNVFLGFQEFCTSYWFILRKTVHFSDYYYEFYYEKTTFVDNYFEYLS